MRLGKKLFAAIIALCTLISCAITQAAVFHTDIRVLLSVGGTSVSFTPVGDYTLREDPSFDIDSEEITVQVTGSQVSLSAHGKTVTAAELTLVSGDYSKKTDYIRLKNDKYSTCTYLGNMTFDVSAGEVRVINTLPTEYYLYGVVANEMSNSFPLEALKAQAVCARGYAVAKCSANAARAYDIRDTSEDQVYKGYASKNARVIAAVDSTRGQVMTYEGDIIEAFYSASNGGQTERTGNVWSTDLPYYVNADDPYDLMNASSIEEKSFLPAVIDENTQRLMDFEVRTALLKAVYTKTGEKAELKGIVDVVPKAASYDAPSRCYTEADVTVLVKTESGTEGQVKVLLMLEELTFGSYDNKLGLLNAKNTRLRMRGAEKGTYTLSNGSILDGWYLTVRRYGHGIGLSQRGAQERARAGQTYTQIIDFYYHGVVLTTIGDSSDAPALTSERYSVRSFGICGIEPGTTAEKLLSRLSSDAESLIVVSAKGTPKDDGLKTGDFVRTVYGSGLSFYDLPVVIYGDVNGDGKISKDDALALSAHLARNPLLTGVYLEASDVDHDHDVDAADLLRLIRYLSHDSDIEQED